MKTKSSLAAIPPDSGNGVVSESRLLTDPSAPAIRDGFVTRSEAVRDALDLVARVAPTDVTVLVTGETGTGKELIARAIHRRSRRCRRSLIAVNVGAVPDPLVATELFGHEPGAFTGALQRRMGRFELADHGTLFLDEVGELSPEMQVALLRVLQEGEFERLGGVQTQHVDVRIVAATHRDLEAEVYCGRFRADLYYRLSVFPIRLPPLRDRAEDIQALAEQFLRGVGARLGREFAGIEPDSLARLQAFSWPGNVRELENVIEHSAILWDGAQLHVPPGLLIERHPRARAAGPLGAVLKHSEEEMIKDALKAARGRVSGPSGAAARLGVPPSTLESKIRKLRIDKLEYRLRVPVAGAPN
jgi:transcriptional regulator with GAF, ATPase, and Fis domain